MDRSVGQVVPRTIPSFLCFQIVAGLPWDNWSHGVRNSVGNSNSEPFTGLNDVLDLGLVIGQNQAFGLIAGRCSAAQAETLRRLREEEKYKRVSPRWRDFCAQYLKINGKEADRIIQYFEEFGSQFFEVSQLTRISPETYREIAPSIQDGKLHLDGEAIELIEGNAAKVSAAVDRFRRAKRPKRQLEMHERLAALDGRCTAILTEFQEISAKERSGENWLQFTAVLSRVSSGLRRIELENGLA